MAPCPLVKVGQLELLWAELETRIPSGRLCRCSYNSLTRNQSDFEHQDSEVLEVCKYRNLCGCRQGICSDFGSSRKYLLTILKWTDSSSLSVTFIFEPVITRLRSFSQRSKKLTSGLAAVVSHGSKITKQRRMAQIRQTSTLELRCRKRRQCYCMPLSTSHDTLHCEDARLGVDRFDLRADRPEPRRITNTPNPQLSKP